MAYNNKAFTLVELIVVIVILTILSTIGFVSYVDYLRGARDSSRVQQVTNLFDAIQLFSTRNQVPIPSTVTTIKFGTNTVGFQGNIDQAILESIQYSEGGKDPKSFHYFPFFVSSDRKSFQILTYFEDEGSVRTHVKQKYSTLFSQSYAVDEAINYEDIFDYDYTDLYPFVYGFELGILLDSRKKAPINTNLLYQSSILDLATSTGTYDSYVSNTEIIHGTGDKFVGIIPRTDCKKLKKLLGGSISKPFKINPSGTKPINSYCNMELDAGGWTLVGRSIPGSVENFGWNSVYGNVFNDKESYSMGEEVKNIRFKEILFTVYDSGKNITSAVKVVIDDIFFNTNKSLNDTVSNIISCEMILTGGLVNPCETGNTGNESAFTQWGKFNLENTFWLGFNNSSSGTLMSYGYTGSTHLGSGVGNSFHGKQGMIFVR